MPRILIAALLAALVLVPASADPVSAQTGPAQRAIVPSGAVWTGYYYNNENWSGAPVKTEQVPYISFDWGYGSPGWEVPSDFFSARWDADVYFYAGTYRFSAVSDDEHVLIVDGVVKMDTRRKKLNGKTRIADFTFTSSGTRRVTVYFREWKGSAYIDLNWEVVKGGGGGTGGGQGSRPGGGSGSGNQCRPPSAPNVQTRYGNFTPCIQNNWHQSSCFVATGAWDSPNMGSITSEPMIHFWGNCTPDQNAYFRVSCDPNVPQASYRCSKTGAGWYPY